MSKISLGKYLDVSCDLKKSSPHMYSGSMLEVEVDDSFFSHGPAIALPPNSRPYKISYESQAELSPHEASSPHPRALFRIRQSESNRS